jgi:hypothetical protein
MTEALRYVLRHLNSAVLAPRRRLRDECYCGRRSTAPLCEDCEALRQRLLRRFDEVDPLARPVRQVQAEQSGFSFTAIGAVARPEWRPYREAGDDDA